MAAKKRLYKSEENKIVSGVIGGIGEYFDIDPTILRLIWLVVTVFTGFAPGVIIYLVAIIVVPQKRT